MKLYELQVRNWSGLMVYDYFTALAEVKKAFNSANKKRKGQKRPLFIRANEVKVRTSLVIADWIKLLRSDAPGPTCDFTPQDLITQRKLLREVDRRGNDKCVL
jgi:hypothetical protein